MHCGRLSDDRTPLTLTPNESPRKREWIRSVSKRRAPQNVISLGCLVSRSHRMRVEEMVRELVDSCSSVVHAVRLTAVVALAKGIIGAGRLSPATIGRSLSG